jgi:acetyl-CoA carboxylase carboxyltransferase component
VGQDQESQDKLSWQPEVDEIRRREALAREMGGTENVARQHSNGRLSVRERIAALVDAGSFNEIGALAGRGVYDDAGSLTSFTPSNFVFGTCRIDGRRERRRFHGSRWRSRCRGRQ